MAGKLEDLWPVGVAVQDVLLPRSLLEFQADSLERRTSGVLRATVHQLEADGQVELTFNVIAQLLDYSYRLFSVRHRLELPYPALVLPPDSLPTFLKATITKTEVVKRGSGFSAFRTSQDDEIRVVEEENPWFAATDDELREKIRDVLGLPESRAIVQSLLARSNAIESQKSSSPSNNLTASKSE